jgi:hypothetical protein
LLNELRCAKIITTSRDAHLYLKNTCRSDYWSTGIFFISTPLLMFRYDLKRFIRIELKIKDTIRRHTVRDRKVRLILMTKQKYIKKKRIVNLDISKGLKRLKVFEKGKFSNEFKQFLILFSAILHMGTNLSLY